MVTSIETLAGMADPKLLYPELSRRGLRGFLECVTIDCKPQPAMFRKVAEPWQWMLADMVIPAFESIAGLRKSYKGPRKFWQTLPRGSDKTSAISRIATWCLCFAQERVRISVAAADTDQAALVRRAMESQRALNPWYANDLVIERRKAYGPTGELEILSADSGTNYGLGSDIYILDEITIWDTESLWTTLFSGRMKRPGCVFYLISNCGYAGSWQHELFNKCKADNTWRIYEAPGLLASWTKEAAEEDGLLLPPYERERLFFNVWVNTKGQSVFSVDLIAQMNKPWQRQYPSLPALGAELS